MTDTVALDSLEAARLLARFKLQVRRLLNQSVDLDKLAHDPDYARTRLAEIEEEADDEELLVQVLRLRALIVPTRAPQPAVAPEQTPGTASAPRPEETRAYKFGARSW